MADIIKAGQDTRLDVLLKSDTIKKRFDEVLGKKAAGFISSVISATKQNKALAECEPMSVISSAMVAATLDLPINSNLGFAHIVPYSNVAQFQMGFKGFIQLAMRTGQYKTINATVVRKGEIRSHNQFTGDMEFNSGVPVSAEPAGYLCYFKLINGFEKYFYMTVDEVKAHGQRYSQMYKRGKGLWVDQFESMALKTVIKLCLSKWGVLSVEMQKAIVSDEGEIDLETGEIKGYPDAEEPKEVKAAPVHSTRLQAVIDVDPAEPAKEQTSMQMDVSDALCNDIISEMKQADNFGTLDKLKDGAKKATSLSDVQKQKIMDAYDAQGRAILSKASGK